MLKKTIALLLALALTAGLLAGCGAAQPRELTAQDWQEMGQAAREIAAEYTREMKARWDGMEGGRLVDRFYWTPYWMDLGDQPHLTHVRRDGESFILEVLFCYLPNDAMEADGFWWGEEPRWEGDWCFAHRQVLVNRIDGEWQYGGSATHGLNTEDFREVTRDENLAADCRLSRHRIVYWPQPTKDPGMTVFKTKAVVQVTAAQPGRFQGVTVDEETPREITVQLSEDAIVPRVGKLVTVFSNLAEKGRLPSVLTPAGTTLVEAFPEDLATP